MPWFKKVSIAILAVVAVILIVGLFLPEKYHAQRSITISAEKTKIFNLVNDLREWKKWSPWLKADANMQLTFSDPTVGGGAWYSWKSKEMGHGKLTITRSIANESIEFIINFQEQSEGRGYWHFKPSGNNIEVTWGFNGDAGNNIIERYMGLMIDMFMGPYFEEGLNSIKKLAES